MVQCCPAHPTEYRPWCLDRRESVKAGDPPCEDPNCDAHRHREEAASLSA